jgi:NADPH:quinone reductase-like Zn-dependent oxidoreductase
VISLSSPAPSPPKTMKGWLLERYGPVESLKFQDLPLPSFRDENELLIRVVASSVNPADRHTLNPPILFRRGQGFLRPKDGRPGLDLAGRVESVGKNVTEFHVGDEVFGAGRGAFGEFAVADKTQLAPKPARLTFEQSASIPIAGITALQGLRDKAQLRSGQRVLINGASGGVGSFAVQIAKALGADVSAVCSTRNVELVRSLGADRVFDYLQEDFTRSGQRFDLIFDTQLNHSLADYRRVLDRPGLLLIVGAGSGSIGQLLGRLLRTLLGARIVGPRTKFFIAKVKTADLIVLAQLVDAGKVTPLIDRTYPLQQVPDGLRYLIAGHARGKISVKL